MATFKVVTLTGVRAFKGKAFPERVSSGSHRTVLVIQEWVFVKKHQTMNLASSTDICLPQVTCVSRLLSYDVNYYVVIQIDALKRLQHHAVWTF